MADFRHSNLRGAALIEKTTHRLLFLFGVDILKIVPGFVSIEADVRLAIDYEGLIQKGHELIGAYERSAMPRASVSSSRLP